MTKRILQDNQLQEMLSQEYQHQQVGIKLHTHRCHECDAQLTCCCQDRRERDRGTGEPRLFWCVSCIASREELERLEAFMAKSPEF